MNQKTQIPDSKEGLHTQNDELPGDQCGAFRFKVEGVIFHGILENAREQYNREKPSKKWYIWLHDNFPIIPDHATDDAFESFQWGTKYAKDKKVDFALLSTIVNRLNNYHVNERKDLLDALEIAVNYVEKFIADGGIGEASADLMKIKTAINNAKNIKQ